jgi:DNA modification methylase
VLDCFVGSGSTVIAAERASRRCYGLELDPIYIDTVVRRWQAYTGEAAVLSSTGETFDDLAKQSGGVA